MKLLFKKLHPNTYRLCLVLCGVLSCVMLGWHFWQSALATQVRQHKPQPSAHVPQQFRGFIQDDQGGPLAGVTITAPTLDVLPQITDANGRFSFQVDLPAGTNFRLIIQKPGFETYTADPPSGDTTFNISLHRAPQKRSR